MEKNAIARASAISVMAFPAPGSVIKKPPLTGDGSSNRLSEEVMEGRERKFEETQQGDKKGGLKEILNRSDGNLKIVWRSPMGTEKRFF
jgi:hypothetical protein